MGVNLNASWKSANWYCDSAAILGYVVIVKDLTIGENVRNVTINGVEETSVTLRNLHYLHNFSIFLMAFNGEGLGPASQVAVSSTYESGNLKMILEMILETREANRIEGEKQETQV